MSKLGKDEIYEQLGMNEILIKYLYNESIEIVE